jgi:putative thioredoxin
MSASESNKGTGTGTGHVIEVTAENFVREVIERSRETPVVVDFWATWCAPCRTLGPVLERLADESNGAFVLAKADTEMLPEIAAEFGVRSIPAVFGLRHGKVVDAFVGALPESAVRAWLNGLLPTASERLVAEARRLEATDPASAASRYRAALDPAPDDPAARTGLARVLLRQGQRDEARALIEALEARGFLEPEAEAVKAELALRDQTAGSGGVDAARAALAADPSDPARTLALAEALAAAGPAGYPEALEQALSVVEAGSKAPRDDARRLMVNVFQLLPPDSDLATDYRRRLSAALY